ncbi:PRD domain-containing protein [Shouchella patagoniensis]|uniref:PRD domain-containing protein n=1 Tax=Shouchella patagoniensis TaxID=228576 RepID=UPI000994F93A|nr:PRD domain-containing protein [Shouchella patagoniensis]
MGYGQYYRKSQNEALCQKLHEEANRFFIGKEQTLESYQEEALVNHLAEMILRSANKAPIDPLDKAMFNELSNESLEQARSIVRLLEHLPDDEAYLLAIHFEVTNYN